MRLLLVNPNTSTATTEAMLAMARSAAASDVVLAGATARTGAPLITNPAQLAVAARAVLDLLGTMPDTPDGVVVSAFGDPGLVEARARLACPVTGIAEAGMAEAADGGRPFAVVTTTPALAEAIGETAVRYGHADAFRGVYLTPGDPVTQMADPGGLEEALFHTSLDAVAAGAQAIVIGGGPLAVAARAIAGRLPVPLIEPVPAAIRLAARRAAGRTSPNG